MPTLASIVCTEIASAPPLGPFIRVPDQAMWSPSSNGACWRASGSPAARVATLGITYIEQNTWPARGWLSSPLAGSGTTPASVKLRQWRPAPAGFGRVVRRGRIGPRHAHRVAGPRMDRRILVIDAEPRVGALGAPEAAVRIVDLEHRRAARVAGVDVDLAGGVVDPADRAAPGVRRLLG